MGSILYDFLSESILFHSESIENEFKNESSARIEKELHEYRNFCIKNIDLLHAEIKSNNSTLKVFSSADVTPISLLKQTALYLDQYILPDILFKFSEPKPIGQQDASVAFGYNRSEMKTKEIAASCKYLKEITPMVVGNFAKIFPVSYYHERNQIPFYAPTDSFENVLPKNILDFFKQNAEVRGMSKMSSGGWAILPGELAPCRGISVEFKNAQFGSGAIYHLVQSEAVSIDEATRTVTFRHFIPDTPPTQEEFDAWINQSINSTARKYFTEIFKELAISSNLNASYIADSSFNSELISRNFNPQDSIENFTATQMLNFELPFLRGISSEVIMNVRQTDSKEFESFRLELEKQVRELRTETDEQKLKVRLDNVFHELSEVQINKINRKFDHVKKQMRIDAALAIGGLSMGFQTGGVSLISTAIALVKGYKDYQTYQQEVKENPSYFLWKVKKQGD